MRFLSTFTSGEGKFFKVSEYGSTHKPRTNDTYQREFQDGEQHTQIERAGNVWFVYLVTTNLDESRELLAIEDTEQQAEAKARELRGGSGDWSLYQPTMKGRSYGYRGND